MRGLGVDHHQLVLVGEQLADLGIGGEEIVELVAPAAPVAAEHHEHPLVLPLRPRGRLGELFLGVGVLVVDRGLLGRGLGSRLRFSGGLGQARSGGDSQNGQGRAQRDHPWADLAETHGDPFVKWSRRNFFACFRE